MIPKLYEEVKANGLGIKARIYCVLLARFEI